MVKVSEEQKCKSPLENFHMVLTLLICRVFHMCRNYNDLLGYHHPIPIWSYTSALQMFRGIYRVFTGKSECGNFKITGIAGIHAIPKIFYLKYACRYCIKKICIPYMLLAQNLQEIHANFTGISLKILQGNPLNFFCIKFLFLFLSENVHLLFCKISK